MNKLYIFVKCHYSVASEVLIVTFYKRQCQALLSV